MDCFYEMMEIDITENLVKQYAAVSGDANPVHLQKSAANQAGFPSQVAHGMLTMAIGSKVISPLLQDGWRLSYYKMRFFSPLFAGDILRLNTKFVTNTDQKIVLTVNGENQRQDRVVSGKMELRSI